MLNKLLKETIKLPRTAIQTTVKEAVKIITWEDDDED